MPVGKEADQQLGGVDLRLISVIEHTKAPDIPRQAALTSLGGEGHELDGLSVDGLSRIVDHRLGSFLFRLVHHRRQLLGKAPAEGDFQRLVVKQRGLLFAVDGVVKRYAVHAAQQFQRLPVGFGIYRIGGVGGIGKFAAVQVRHQCTGALIAVLAGAVHGGRRLAILAVQRLDGLDKLFGGPCAGGQVDVLVSSGRDKGVIVDGHTLHIHGQRIHVAFAVCGKAGALTDVVDLGLIRVVPHVGKVGQQSLSAPDFHQLFRPSQQQIGRQSAVHGGAHRTICSGLVQALYRYVNVGIDTVELRQQRFHSGLIAPVSGRVGPQRQLNHVLTVALRRVPAASGQRQDQREGQQNSQQFFHLISSLYFSFFHPFGEKTAESS